MRSSPPPRRCSTLYKCRGDTEHSRLDPRAQTPAAAHYAQNRDTSDVFDRIEERGRIFREREARLYFVPKLSTVCIEVQLMAEV